MALLCRRRRPPELSSIDPLEKPARDTISETRYKRLISHRYRLELAFVFWADALSYGWPLHDIEIHEVSDDFACCWQAAGRHIERQVQAQIPWLKANLDPPFLEHLSFRLGNQLFFVRLEDVDRKLEVPASRQGLLAIAEGCNGHACLMPMQREREGWIATGSGWGLLDLRTGRSLDPVSLVSDEPIEMTDWELQDFAVQIVRDHLETQGRKLMSWQGNPSADPSIWFIGNHGPEWVLVRAVRHSKKSAELPGNWHAIAAKASRIGKTGHFASVSLVNAEGGVDRSDGGPPVPLWRGHAILASFESLVPGP